MCKPQYLVKSSKKTNIVIYNLKEPNSEECSGRKDQDLTKVNSILQTIGLSEEISTTDDFLAFPRLGKRAVPISQRTSTKSDAAVADSDQPPLSKPRPLLEKFPNYAKADFHKLHSHMDIKWDVELANLGAEDGCSFSKKSYQDPLERICLSKPDVPQTDRYG